MPIDLGGAITRSVDVTNAAGNAADADTTPTYAITLPDGSPGIAPTVNHGSTGEYYVVYTPTVYGPHEELWTAVVSGLTIVIPDNFTVEQSSVSFISPAEVLTHMRATTTITEPVDLEQLRWLCLVASDAVERDTGRMLGRHTFTDTFDGGRDRLKLRKVPPRHTDGGAIEVLACTENGIALVEGRDFIVRRNGWELVRGTSQARSCWWDGIENIEVTYATTCNPVPTVARKVGMNGVQRMWQGSQQVPLSYSDDISADAAIGAVVAGTLTPLELAAYRSLGRVPIA